MATKITITCDHCGNKIPKPNRFSFGPSPSRSYDEDEDETEEYSPKKRQKTAAVPLPKKETIDLCNLCVPIWMDRVRKLTTASDPE